MKKYIEKCWQRPNNGELVINLNYFTNENEIILKRCALLRPFQFLSIEDFSKIRDIISYVETLNLKHFELSPGLEDRCKKCRPPKQIKKVSVGLSKACNLHCYHCFVGESHSDSEGLKELYFNTLNNIKGHYLNAIKFTDIGEPFFYYNETRDYLKSLKYEIDTKRVEFISNLTLLNKARIEELKQISSQSKISYFFIASIDGINKDTYENTRIGSTFEKVLENLKLLVDSFGPDNIQFQYVIKLPNQADNHSQIKNFFFQNFKICGQITYDTLELDESSKKTFHNFER